MAMEEDQTTAAGDGDDVGPVDAHTIRARQNQRDQLAADLEAFIESGGKVTEVAPNLRADPPRKPQNNYGKGSI